MAISCHEWRASTLPWRRHRPKTKLLPTRAAINCPCVLLLSIVLATCLGLASSNAVLMSKLAQHIVGRTTLPVPSVFGVTSSLSLAGAGSLSHPLHQHADSSNLQALFLARRRIIPDANHFDITDVSAMALQFLIPFFGSASGLLKKTSFRLGQIAESDERSGEGQ